MDWKPQRGSKVFSLTGVLFCVLVFSLGAQPKKKNLLQEFDTKIKEKSKVIDSIRIELERGRKTISQLEKKEKNYLSQLELLEKNIDAARRYLTEVTGNIDTMTIHIDMLQDSIQSLSVALTQRQKKMIKRLRYIYMSGQPKIIEVILTAKNVSEILRRNKYFQALNRYDKNLIRTIDSTRSMIEQHTEHMITQQDELIALKQSKEEESVLLEKEQKDRTKVLGEVTAEKDAYVVMVKELERAQQELNLLVKRLEERRKKAKLDQERSLKVAFQKRVGKLPWPVSGPIIRDFGKIVHPVYKTVIMSNGIDIKIAKGNSVYCVAPGTVDYVGWMRGYGKFVIVNHYGGYLTIYAHLEKIEVAQDQEIDYGASLGVSGDTGSLDGPKLHFQIRHLSETLNPNKWLEKRE